MNRADPSETRAWVLMPAAHSNRSRSRPTSPSKTAATKRRKTSSLGGPVDVGAVGAAASGSRSQKIFRSHEG